MYWRWQMSSPFCSSYVSLPRRQSLCRIRRFAHQPPGPLTRSSSWIFLEIWAWPWGERASNSTVKSGCTFSSVSEGEIKRMLPSDERNTSRTIARWRWRPLQKTLPERINWLRARTNEAIAFRLPRRRRRSLRVYDWTVLWEGAFHVMLLLWRASKSNPVQRSHW